MNKYLVATGNWSDPAIWSATSGGAGGAGVPTASDSVYIDKDYIVTLDHDAVVGSLSPTEGYLYMTNGTLRLNGYTLNAGYSASFWGGTLDMGNSGTLYAGDYFYLSDTASIINTSGSLIQVDRITSTEAGLYSSGNTIFGDVIINLGVNTSVSVTGHIYGSPTFRLLDIRSANSAAHTVKLDDGATLTVNKFIAIGSSSANKLTIDGANGSSFTTLPFIKFTDYSTSYGQYVDMRYVSATVTSSLAAKPYIGSNSTRTISSGATPFLTQNPPKISTLVDPLTTAPGSNPNWTVTGTVTQVTSGHDGGGYAIGSIPNTSGSIVSTDTYDFSDSTVIFQTDTSDIDVSTSFFATTFYPYIFTNWETGSIEAYFSPTQSYVGSTTPLGEIGEYYIKLSLNSSNKTITFEKSTDGLVWTNSTSVVLSDDDFYLYKSVRAGATAEPNGATNTNFVLGSINPSLISAPAVTTGAATNLANTTVTLAGNVTSDGGATITERGIVYATTTNPTTANSKKTVAGTTGTYTANVTGLTAGTTYHYRAYAINSIGTSYGDDKTFTTLAPFTPDQGDGHWTYSVSGSSAIVSRDQPTSASSSCNLPLEDLILLENGAAYTLAVGDITSDNGDPKLVLQWYDGATQHEQDIPANSQYTFTYDTNLIHWSLRLFVTQGTAVSDNITATFSNMYLAKEASFSSYVDFVPRGVTEVKIVNNQIVDSRREDVIDSIFQKLKGFSYYPFEIDTEGLGWFQIGDGFDITDEDNNTINVIAFDSKLTLDGGITENLKADEPTNTTTDYSKAGSITKLISNTTLQVDKQNETITALVADVYDDGGYIDNKFSEVTQTVDEVKTTVQGAGGVNLVRNSVMYSYNNLGYPDNWTTVNDTGNAAPLIQASPESISAGGISGNTFTLIGQKVTQTVPVKKDADFIADDQKTYYTLSMKVKKNVVGAGYVKLSNRNETHQIDLPDQTSYYWDDVVIPMLLPSDDHYDLEIYSDSDAAMQVTDVMLSIGQDRHTWTQAPGELSNTNVSITQDGMTIRADQFRYNYTVVNALGFEVHKRLLGEAEQIFGFNDDVTTVSKLSSDKEIGMQSTRMVPVNYSGLVGWAFVPSKETS